MVRGAVLSWSTNPSGTAIYLRVKTAAVAETLKIHTYAPVKSDSQGTHAKSNRYKFASQFAVRIAHCYMLAPAHTNRIRFTDLDRST